MKRLRSFFTINFTIYAALILLQAILDKMNIIIGFDSTTALQYFTLSTLLSLMTIIMDKVIKFKSAIYRIVTTIICATLIVIILGDLLFKWFTISLKWISLSSMISIVITIILYFITGHIFAVQTADHINRVIEHKKEKGKKNYE